jgi:hypothetical protein
MDFGTHLVPLQEALFQTFESGNEEILIGGVDWPQEDLNFPPRLIEATSAQSTKPEFR